MSGAQPDGGGLTLPTTAELSIYDVLENTQRRELVDVVELAASICAVPMSSINVFADGQQFLVATTGMDPLVCSMEDSICGSILGEQPPVAINDASLDPRFATNPYVDGREGSIRFYASHVLQNSEAGSSGRCASSTSAPANSPTPRCGHCPRWPRGSSTPWS